MATLLELYNMVSDAGTADLRKKITTAIAIKAYDISELPTPTDEQKVWAKDALANPEAHLDEILHYLLAANEGSSVAAIQGAADGNIKTQTSDAIDNLFGV